MVVAGSCDQALDAAELVAVDIEPLASVVDAEAALSPESAVIGSLAALRQRTKSIPEEPAIA